MADGYAGASAADRTSTRITNAMTTQTLPRLKERYRQEVVPALMSEFNYKNVMQVPRLQKIVVNIGLGEAVQNARALDSAAGDVTAITGQKPIITRAKRSIANFKIRTGL